jgi:hypothetical protein
VPRRPEYSRLPVAAAELQSSTVSNPDLPPASEHTNA